MDICSYRKIMTQKEVNAFHEAAHAVACFLHGFEFDQLQIEGNDLVDNLLSNFNNRTSPSMVSSETLKHLARLLYVVLAGPAMDEINRGSFETELDNKDCDLQKALELPNEYVKNEVIEQLIFDTFDDIQAQLKDNFAAVKTLADTLLIKESGCLDYHEAKNILAKKDILPNPIF
jgi:hypothetical protein